MILGLAPAENPLAWAPTVSWSIDSNPVCFMILSGDTTVTPTGGINGGHYQLSFIQDGTGNHTVTLVGVTILGGLNWSSAAGTPTIMNLSIVNNVNYATLTS